ncbi:hypothetical protein BN59_02140 [Legionella massiliensis]|uniref:Uncharacterized protein n=1 Tax=Legionella massiliensis TaxID=1034943 RepID=A0A078KXV2_9GAMM|nr:hypothetical protein [Legionella massiliensis]CDZ77847.1 hypothetical protein BN59_02140 [Legionella massiliensis]CEE13585.1 hypothetical protein BN1094_02140 [Legionella massiliensis]
MPKKSPKQVIEESLENIYKEVSLYNAAKDRLKLHLGHADLDKYSLSAIKADMQQMADAVANLKRMELPEGLHKYALAPGISKLKWAHYE